MAKAKDNQPKLKLNVDSKNKEISSLLQTKNFLHSVLKSSTEYAITVCDFDGLIQFWNTGAEKLTGYSSWDVIGVKNIKDFYPDEFKEKSKIEAAWQETLQKGKYSWETEVIRRDGKRIPISITITPLYDRHNKLIGTLGISRNISDQIKLQRKLDNYTKRLETKVRNRTQELEETANWLSSIIDKATDGIIIHANGVIDSINPAISEISGYSGKELKGTHVMDYIPAEKDKELVLSKMQKRIDGKDVKEPYLIRIKRKNGTLMDAQITAGLISKNPPKFVSIIRDITDELKLKAENEEIQQQLWQTGKLAALGELAAGIAHEINNPLMGIIGYAQLTMDKLEENSKEYNNMKAIVEETDRISKILHNLFIFANQQKQDYVMVDLVDILKASISLIKYQYGKDGINIQLALKENLPPILARKSQLQEVFINLLTNAQFALNKKYRKRSPHKYIKINANKIRERSGNMIVIEFYDNGIGIPKDCIDEIFTPFYSSKEEGEGIGLGLSITKGIIDNHKGYIDVESKEGEFTKFTLKFPIVK